MIDETYLALTADILSVGTINTELGFPSDFTYVSAPNDALQPSIADKSAITPSDMQPLYAQFIAQAIYQYRV